MEEKIEVVEKESAMNASQRTVVAFVKALAASGEPAGDIADALLVAGGEIVRKMGLREDQKDGILAVVRKVMDGQLAVQKQEAS